MSSLAERYNRARANIAARGFSADIQTKITLFVGTTTSINAAILAPIELQPRVSAAYPFVHGQYFRELEFASLLARVTHWSANSAIYAEAMKLTAPLWSTWWRIQSPLGPVMDVKSAYTALALGHALLGRVRLTPAIPEHVDDLDPYVTALRRIEQENGRMIQTQIRLLKDAAIPLDVNERERIVAEQQSAVDSVFLKFLDWLGD